jgi:hypothetical protein
MGTDENYQITISQAFLDIHHANRKIKLEKNRQASLKRRNNEYIGHKAAFLVIESCVSALRSLLKVLRNTFMLSLPTICSFCYMRVNYYR